MEQIVMTIMWAAFFMGALFIEAQTAELLAVWFVPGTIISLILATCGVPAWIQWIVFAVISTTLVILALTVFRKKLLKNHGSEPTDTDLLLGRDALVTEDINNPLMTGAVKIDGKEWSARMTEDSETAAVGEFVTIQKISGVKLICKRK